MDENMKRTPHPEEPAEGGTDIGGSDFETDRSQGGTDFDAESPQQSTDYEGADLQGGDPDGTGLDADRPQDGFDRETVRPEGDPAVIPEHNSAPDGYTPAETGTDAAVDARDATHVTDADADARRSAEDATSGGSASADGMGGAIQGDSPPEESTGGAIQGDAGPRRDAHLGGDATTEEQLDADNEVEEDTLKTLDPDDPPA